MKPLGLLLFACLVVAASVWAADPPLPGNEEWKYDIVYRKKAKPLQGLVIEDKPDHVKMLSIIRKPGAATVVMQEVITRPEIDRIEMLSDADREVLEQRVKALKQDRELLAEQVKLFDPSAPKKKLADLVTLQAADWPADPKVKALRYQSTYFTLVSNAKEEVVQLAAIQLEQVFAAYAHALPPRAAAPKPTVILLTASVADYKALTHDRGANLLNPAFYDEDKNQVVCGSDLQRLSEELDSRHKKHVELDKELTAREKELERVYKGAIPVELNDLIPDARRTILKAEEANGRAFRDAQRKLFQRLYHEAFHAYLATAVYPRSEGELPRWLNEGLAQIFETAIFEAGELRVGHADKARLDAVREALKKNQLLPLTDLLRSGPKQFQVAHGDDKQASDKHYLASWALAFYLTFDRKVLGKKPLDDYVKALQHGTDPLEAFQDLVGTPLPQFEKEFQEYLQQLQPDGSVRR